MSIERFRRAALIFLAAFFVTVVARGVVAWQTNVFTAKGVRSHLTPDVAKRLYDYEAEQKQRKAELKALDERFVAGSLSGQELNAVLAHREALAATIDRARPPVTVIPFFLGNTMFLWPLIYTCLGWIIWLLSSHRRERWLDRTFVVCTLSIYAFLGWPTWVRNVPVSANEELRKVYAAANWDISKPHFVGQELVVFGMSTLIAVIWLDWLELRDMTIARAEGDRAEGALWHSVTDHSMTLHLSNMFHDWVGISLILTLGFLPFTYYYWSVVSPGGDPRYILNALTLHVVWGATWFIVSAPLFVYWRCWNDVRLAAIAQAAGRSLGNGVTSKDVLDITVAALNELTPIPKTNVFVAAISAAASFALPLIQLVAK